MYTKSENSTSSLSLISPKAISHMLGVSAYTRNLYVSKIAFELLKNDDENDFIRLKRYRFTRILVLEMRAMDLIHLMECETFELNPIRKYSFNGHHGAFMYGEKRLKVDLAR